jgi:Glycosyltransferase
MEKFTFIYTPTIDYEFMKQRPQHLMEQFAKNGHQVYYINYNEQNKEPIEIKENLTILYNHNQIFNVEKKYPVVLWMSWAKTHDWIEKINPYISVYDCLDDFKDWREYEKEIIKKVDLVTTTADTLYNKMKNQHNNVVLVKNACEYSHFENIENNNDPKDWPFRSEEKVIGYVGALGHWVDADLIIKLAEKNKIVLIGPQFGMKKINHPNVAIMGIKNYEELPCYIKKMHTLIIPFSLNEITISTNPIKMYEYLATGKPVISTKIPEAVLYKEVYTANDDNEFLRLVNNSLLEKFNNKLLIDKRKKLAFENSWEERYKTIYNSLVKINLEKNEIKNENITIIFPPGFDYNFMYQRPHQLSKSLAKLGTNVVYVNPATIINQEQDILIPFEEFNNFKVIKKNVDIKSFIKGKVVIICPVTMEYSLDEYKHDISVLDSCDLSEDEFSSHKEMLYSFEKRADIVISTAKAIYEDHLSRGIENVLISNGADYSHFYPARNRIGKNPFQFNNKRKIVGFYGALHTWVDYDLIVKISEKYNVVLIGASEYFDSQNVESEYIKVLPVQHYNNLPYYLSWFDVALLPFKLSKMMSGTNPVKFFEYLSAGKPVIATKLEELKKYENVCYLTDIDNVLNDIELALKEDCEYKRNERRKVAMENSWDKKAEELLNVIKDKLRG